MISSLVALFVWAGTLAVVYVRASEYFYGLEGRAIEKDVLLARRALQAELARIDTACNDWSCWNDLYAYAGGRPDWNIADGVSPQTFANLQINHILLLDRQRRPLFERAFRLDPPGDMPAPAVLRIRFIEEGYFDTVLGGRSVRGFMNLGNSVAAFAAHPVRRHDGLGSPQGVLIFSAMLLENIDLSITEAPGVRNTLIPFNNQDFFRAGEMPVSLESAATRPLLIRDENAIRGLLLFGDVSGLPAFILSSAAPREIYHSGMAWARGFVYLFGVVGLLVFFTLYICAFTVVTVRLRSVHAALRAALDNHDYAQACLVGGNDEIAALARISGALLQRLARKECELELNVARCAHIFGTCTDGVLWCDPRTGRVIAANAAFARMAGREGQDSFAEADFAALFAEDEGRRYLLDKLAREQSYSTEAELRGPDTAAVPVRLISQLFACCGEELLQVVVHDLSQSRQLVREMEEARRQAQESCRRKDEFINTVSHELRTPLNAIIGFIDLADEAQSAGESTRLIGSIRKESSHMLGLISDLLDNARIEAGMVALHPRPFAFAEFVCDIAESVRALLAGRGLNFFLNAPDIADVWYSADRLRLRQVLMNLLSNAIKFTPKGSITLRIGISTAGEGAGPDEVCFTISDTGVGIPEEVRSRLFDSYFQVGEFGGARGSGLGLFIACRLAKILGGSLDFRSTVGQGTDFVFRLPLQRTVRPQAADAAAASAQGATVADNDSASSAGNAAPGGATAGLPVVESACVSTEPARILLVEDYALNRQVASAFIKSAGHEVEVALNGQEAVEMGLRREYALIFMDIQLPLLDGFAATREIRAQGPNVKTPIVGLTAYADNQTAEKTRAAGMNELLPKPFPKEDFLAVIARYVGLRQRRNSAESAGAAEPVELLPREYIVQHYFFGKRDMAEKALDMFLRDTQGVLAELGAAIERSDFETVVKNAHTAKSGAGYLGLSVMQDILQAMCEAARDASDSTARQLLAEAIAEYKRIRELRQAVK